MRAQIAREAARLMLEGGQRDYQAAKRKAANRLGVDDRGEMPNNVEIEAAVSDYQRLFRADTQPRYLAELRQAALSAMRFLDAFEPRLVGSVLHGTADEHSVVELQLYVDAPEEVGLYLDDRGIPYELGENRLRVSSGDVRMFPAFTFMAGEAPIELTILPDRMVRQPPLSPVTGKAMSRATIKALSKLIDANAAAAETAAAE